MTPVKWIVLALLAAAALVGAGWLLCHAQSEAQSVTAIAQADSVERVRDDTVSKLQVVLAARDSAAVVDSLLAIALTGTHTLDVAAVASARKEFAAGQLLLVAASTVADSVVVYRDQIVPALQLEVADLSVQVSHSDSSAAAWHSAFDRQVEASAALRALVSNDSGLIASQRLAIAKASAVPVVALSFWPSVGSLAETGAIGLVTLRACEDHAISLSCAAGVGDLIARTKPWKVLKR